MATLRSELLGLLMVIAGGPGIALEFATDGGLVAMALTEAPCWCKARSWRVLSTARKQGLKPIETLLQGPTALLERVGLAPSLIPAGSRRPATAAGLRYAPHGGHVTTQALPKKRTQAENPGSYRWGERTTLAAALLRLCRWMQP